MIAIDTNVLVRFLLADDERQHREVCDFVEAARDAGTQLLVLTPILCEAVWVLLKLDPRLASMCRPQVLRRAILDAAQVTGDSSTFKNYFAILYFNLVNYNYCPGVSHAATVTLAGSPWRRLADIMKARGFQ